METVHFNQEKNYLLHVKNRNTKKAWNMFKVNSSDCKTTQLSQILVQNNDKKAYRKKLLIRILDAQFFVGKISLFPNKIDTLSL